MTQQIETGMIPEFDLADRMRKTLRTSGVSVQEMSEYLDVARNSVGNWINGRIDPSKQTLRLWALRTGVPLEWLETGKTPAGNNPDGGESAPSRARTGDLRIKRAFVAPVVPLFGGDRNREGNAA